MMNINININFSNNLKKINLNFILIAILFLAAFLRFYQLSFQGVWLDEIHTLKEADPNLSFKELHELIMWREGIPHFYFILVRIFGIIFTHSLFSIRLLSVVTGILAVYSIYLLGKEMKSKQLGYIAAFLLALQPFHIEYSQEGRSYSLLVLFVIISFYRLVLFLKESNLKNAIFLGIFLGLITNAHPIGIVNVISVFLIIFVCFFFIKDKKEKVKYFKNTFISGITTLGVFFPVYQIVAKVSDIQSFWVQKPSFDYVIQVLTNLSGGIIVFYLVLLSFVLVLVKTINSFVKIKEKVESKNDFINGLIIFNWIVFFFLFILMKSLGEASIFLNRYLISLVPGFVLLLALAIENIKIKYIKHSIVLLISVLFMYVLLVEKKYYSTNVKAQFNEISEQVKKENKNNEVVISNWGWLLSYFLDRNNEIKNVYEKNLDLYINDVKTNSVIQENFWYVDGNSRPYSVTPETQAFLDKNYVLEKSIDLQDCWAKHYISDKPVDLSKTTLKLNQFKNAQYDGSGNLMFFENSKSSSLPIVLEKGNYTIEISCLSNPTEKIDNENAKFIVFINDNNNGTFEASEKQTKTFSIDYIHNTNSKFKLDIAFINDFSEEKLDRNLQISKIEIKLK